MKEVTLTQKHIQILAIFGTQRQITWATNPRDYFFDERAGVIYDPDHKLTPHYGNLLEDEQFQELVNWHMVEVNSGGLENTHRIAHPSKWLPESELET